MNSMSQSFQCSKRLVYSWTGFWAFLSGLMLYTIIATPDEGGIWDGYVPTWLGGEGPSPAVQLEHPAPIAEPAGVETRAAVTHDRMLVVRQFRML